VARDATATPQRVPQSWHGFLTDIEYVDSICDVELFRGFDADRQRIVVIELHPTTVPQSAPGLAQMTRVALGKPATTSASRRYQLALVRRGYEGGKYWHEVELWDRGRPPKRAGEFSPAVKRAALRLAGGVCAHCGEVPARPEFDHVIPVVAGGEAVLSNAQVLCSKCHRRKTSGEARGAGRPFPAPVRRDVRAAAGGRCAVCRETSPRLELDYVIPLRWGGTCDIANARMLCRPCHRAKTKAERERDSVRLSLTSPRTVA
jgi:5-methylcytosine-specific restriction endonuclease McrA